MNNPISEAIALLQRNGYEIVKRESLQRIAVQVGHPQFRWDKDQGIKDWTWRDSAQRIGRHIHDEARHLLRHEVVYPDPNPALPPSMDLGMCFARTTFEFYPVQGVEFRR